MKSGITKPYAKAIHAETREYLGYDPEAGEIIWLKRPGRTNCKIGGRAGTPRADGYRIVIIFGERHFEHRLAWWLHYGEDVRGLDHINGDPSDNRICNLRKATRAENMRNVKTPKSNKSGAKGVFYRSGKWVAGITKDRRRHYLGRFDTLDAAKAAYESAARKMFGEFARIEA